MRSLRIVMMTAATLLLGIVVSAPAQTPAAPYDFNGRTIRFLVGNAAGGITDTEMRLVARHIVHHLPGSPTIVVQNLPGAGGLRMLEFVSQLDPIAEPTLFQLSSSIPFQARAAGATPLALSHLRLASANATALVANQVDGQVTVSSGHATVTGDRRATRTIG